MADNHSKEERRYNMFRKGELFRYHLSALRSDAPSGDSEDMRAEMRKREEAKMKISGYEDYKAGKVTRKIFLERKKVLDIRRQELSAAVSELVAQ